MKKRVNLIAVLFCACGAIFLVGSVPTSLAIHDFAQQVAAAQGAGVAKPMASLNILSEVRSAFLYGGQLIGIGVLIELVDQIRWNALQRTVTTAR